MKRWKNLFSRRFQKGSSFLDWMQKNPLTSAVLLTSGVFVAFHIAACGVTTFMHGAGGNASSCTQIDPRALINTTCDEGPEEVFHFDPENPNDPRNPGETGSNISSEIDGYNAKEFTMTQTLKIRGKADFLFVVDNSSSMHEEHLNIADQFSEFMDDIEDYDYRVAITLPDISSSPCNSRREYQDGAFVEFDDGSIFLHNNEEKRSAKNKRHRKNKKLFEEAIVREETISCAYEGDLDGDGCPENPGDCPTDERAICALNMALDRSQERNFFREDPDVHLMVIVISDEDERSSEDYISRQLRFRGGKDYSFESCDYPETFYINVYNKIGPTKGYSIHSIIIPPGDSVCLNSQKNEHGGGSYGEVYAEFAQPSAEMRARHPGLNRGSVISICDRSYASQLGQLSDYIRNSRSATLPCVPSRIISVKEGSEDIRYRLEGQKLIIEEDVSIDSQLKVRYTCPRGE